MKKWMCVLLLPLLLTTSCTLSVMDRQAYALCMSIDLEEDGRIKVGIFSPMSDTTDQSVAAEGYTLFSGTGNTLEDAFTIASASTACRINFSQLKLCILGKELASKKQLRPLLRQIVTLHDMRPECIVMVSLTKGEEVLKAIKPDFGLRMSTYLSQTLQRLQDAGLSPKSTLVRCVRDLAEPETRLLVGICAVNKTIEEEQKNGSSGGSGSSQPKEAGQGAPTFSEHMDTSPWKETKAGEVPRNGINPVDFPGSALVEGGVVTVIYDAETTQLLLGGGKQTPR